MTRGITRRGFIRLATAAMPLAASAVTSLPAGTVARRRKAIGPTMVQAGWSPPDPMLEGGISG